MRLADRIERLGTETAFRVLQQISEFPEERKRRVISFAIGEPDFNTPEHIKQAAIRAIQENKTHYVSSAGIPELREEIAKFASQQRNIRITPDMVQVFNSGKMTIGMSILSVMNEGDEVIYPNPGYPIYESMIRVFGGKAVPFLLKESDKWNYNVDRLRHMITDKTKMIILNSPQNPTGGLLSKENLEAIAEICLDHDLWVLSDEIYAEFVYDPGYEFHSIAEIPGMQERTIILDGFSKFFAMTGWRLGYAIANPEIIKVMTDWATNFISCAPPFVQEAGVVALRSDKSPSYRMVEILKQRRDLIVRLLNDIPGISVIMPRGAFYLFANVTEACRNLGLKDALAFQEFLLEKANVAVLARDFFGERDREEDQEYVRFSYCVSTQDIINGCNRIKTVVMGGEVDYSAEVTGTGGQETIDFTQTPTTLHSPQGVPVMPPPPAGFAPAYTPMPIFPVQPVPVYYIPVQYPQNVQQIPQTTPQIIQQPPPAGVQSVPYIAYQIPQGAPMPAVNPQSQQVVQPVSNPNPQAQTFPAQQSSSSGSANPSDNNSNSGQDNAQIAGGGNRTNQSRNTY